MEFLFNAVFNSFWTFAGTTILFGIAVQGIVAVVGLLVVGVRGNER